jgi:hypothetical protein
MAKMFRKTGLPRVTVKDPNVREWALRISKTLDDLSTEQAQQIMTYITEQITNVTNDYTTEITNIENNYGIMLTGTNGTIWQIWDGVITELPPDRYGMVLVCGGGTMPNFWDWVWNAPGGDAATSFVIDCVVSASVADSKPTMDHTSDQGDGAITTVFVSSEGPQPQLFEEWDFSVTAVDATSKPTMDHTSDQGAAAITSELIVSPYEVEVYDSVAVTEAVAIEIQVYEVNVYDSIGVTEDTSVAIV